MILNGLIRLNARCSFWLKLGPCSLTEVCAAAAAAAAKQRRAQKNAAKNNAPLPEPSKQAPEPEPELSQSEAGVDAVASSELFAGLSREDCAELAGRMPRRTVADGEFVFEKVTWPERTSLVSHP